MSSRGNPTSFSFSAPDIPAASSIGVSDPAPFHHHEFDLSFFDHPAPAPVHPSASATSCDSSSGASTSSDRSDEPSKSNPLPLHRKRGRKPGPQTPQTRDSLGRFPCSHSGCNQTFVTGQSLRRHEIRHSANSKPYSCDVCGMRFTQNYSAVLHKRSQHIGNRLVGRKPRRVHHCNDCSAEFNRAKLLQQHILREHSEIIGARKRGKDIIRGFHCKICPISFQRKQNYDLHQKFHAKFYETLKAGVPLQRIKITDKVRDIWNRLPHNARVKTKFLHAFDPVVELPRCEECGYEGLSPYMIPLHVKRVHGQITKKIYKCDHCSARFREERQLQRHVLTVHMKQTTFESKYCSRTFIYQNGKLRHERSHEQRGICVPPRADSYAIRSEEANRSRNCQLCHENCLNAFQFVQHFLEKHRGKCCYVNIEQLVIKPIDETSQELDQVPTVLCTTCGNRFKASEFKIHLALTPATCGALECVPPADFEMEEPADDGLGASDAFNEFENEDFNLSDEEMEEVQNICSNSSPPENDFEEEPEIQTEPQSEQSEPVGDTQSPELDQVEIKVEADQECKLCDAPPMLKSELRRHIRDLHLHPVSVSLNRMLFKPIDWPEKMRWYLLSTIRPSDDNFNIPWYICGRCGRAFAFTGPSRAHCLDCTRLYDFVHRNWVKGEAAAKLPPAEEPTHPGGWYDRWDAHLFPETKPHPSTRAGVVMVGPVAFCATCPHFFRSSRYIEGHLGKHEFEKRVKAQVNISDESKWRDFDGGRIQCTTCEQVFGPTMGKIYRAKREHYATKHCATKPKFFSCEYCGREFLRRNGYIIHVRLHTGEKPFSCDHCPRKFASGAHLYQHKIGQHDNNSYACEVCGKVYTKLFSLKIHVKTHQQQMPKDGQSQSKRTPLVDPHCPECGKKFAHPTRMRMHRMSAHGVAQEDGADRIFSCSKCPEIFTDKNSLKRHEIALHPPDGAPPPKFFECKLCDKGFLQIASMRSHLRRLHADQLEPPELLHQNSLMISGVGEDGVTTAVTTHSLETYFLRNKWSKFR